MKDRVPLYPGRVKLTPVTWQENTFDLVRADQPTQEGTPLNKASLMKDATAALFGLGTDAVPDDAFSLLSRFHKGLGNEYLWEKSKSDEISYVNSPDPNAYPPAVSDGYTYTALGQLGNGVQIETGSYVGTGSGQVTLSFSKPPKLLILSTFSYQGAAPYYIRSMDSSLTLTIDLQAAYQAIYGPMKWMDTNGSITYETRISKTTTVPTWNLGLSKDLKTVTFGSSVSYGFNEAGRTYAYTAIL